MIKILVLVVSVFLSEQSFALRCGNKLIDKGDSKPKVISVCGEPTYKELREVLYPPHCNSGIYKDDIYDRRGFHYYQNSSHYVNCRYRNIDVWTYNFGPRKFMVELIFRRGRVYEINTLEYGY